MPTQPAPNIVQIVIRYIVATQNVQNVLHAHKPTDWTDDDLDDLATALETAINANFDGAMTADVSAVELILTALEDLDSPRLVYPLDPVVTGTLVGHTAANNVTFAIKLNTGKRGRGRNGRVFAPAVPEQFVASNVIDAAWADLMVAYYSALQNAVEQVGDAQLVVLHRVRDGAPLPSADSDPVTSINYTDLYADSQKNRLPNHKRRSSTAP